MVDLWERFYKEYPNGAYCEECGHEMYVSDPPHDIHCENTNCGQCPDYVQERCKEQEAYDYYARYGLPMISDDDDDPYYQDCDEEEEEEEEEEEVND